jgi:hypothetical protein
MTARAGTETAAANGALAHMGEPPIGNLTEATHKAKTLRTAFGDVRDRIQRAKHWNCCTAWVRPSPETGESTGPLKHRYRMPADCLGVRFVDGLAEDEWAIEAVEGDEEAMILVTASLAPLVCYSRRVISPALWDALLLTAFEYELAARTAPTLARNKSIIADLRVAARDALNEGAMTDSREKARGTISRDTSWIAARRR